MDVHSQGGVTSVVSAHNVSGGRCREHGKHTTDRVAAGAGAVRCHTETDRQLAVAATQHRNDQLDNCDRSVANVMMKAENVGLLMVLKCDLINQFYSNVRAML